MRALSFYRSSQSPTFSAPGREGVFGGPQRTRAPDCLLEARDRLRHARGEGGGRHSCYSSQSFRSIHFFLPFYDIHFALFTLTHSYLLLTPRPPLQKSHFALVWVGKPANRAAWW